jgi:hypothetical protein
MLEVFTGDETAQATTEYVLMLSVIVPLLLMVIKKLIQPGFASLTLYVDNLIQKKLFGADLHTFRVSN